MRAFIGQIRTALQIMRDVSGVSNIVPTFGQRFVLLTEANILRDNTGAYLTNAADSSIYKIKLSDERLICPSGWYSPWRVAIIGTLADIVESTLVTDVSEPCKSKIPNG